MCTAFLQAIANNLWLYSPAESAVSKLEVERMRGTLQAVLLQPEEVEAAALQCAWLAHYWVSRRRGRVIEASWLLGFDQLQQSGAVHRHCWWCSRCSSKARAAMWHMPHPVAAGPQQPVQTRQ
jgi:hypothetical protein